MAYKLGVSAINWVNENPELFEERYTGEQMLAEMSALGYQGTEMSRLFPREPDKLRAWLDRAKMSLSSGWVSVWFSDRGRRERELAAFREQADFLHRMGASFVNVCEIKGDYATPLTDEEWTSLTEGLHEAGRYCRELGMRLVYHYHAETVIEREEDVDRLVRSTDPALVSLLYDTGHAYYAGIDPLALLVKHGDRIRYVHLKDVRPDVLAWKRQHGITFQASIGKGLFTVPGDGCIDFAPIMDLLKARGYDGWIVIEAEQDPAIANPREYAEKAIDYLARLG